MSQAADLALQHGESADHLHQALLEAGHQAIRGPGTSGDDSVCYFFADASYIRISLRYDSISVVPQYDPQDAAAERGEYLYHYRKENP